MNTALCAMAPIMEEDSVFISDSMSTLSTNSRNFQMPEKDFIMEINRMKSMQGESHGMRVPPIPLSTDGSNPMLDVSLSECNVIHF